MNRYKKFVSILRMKIRNWRKVKITVAIPLDHVGRFIEVMSNFNNPEKKFTVVLQKRKLGERLKNPDADSLLILSIPKHSEDMFEIGFKAFCNKYGIHLSA